LLGETVRFNVFTKCFINNFHHFSWKVWPRFSQNVPTFKKINTFFCLSSISRQLTAVARRSDGWASARGRNRTASGRSHGVTTPDFRWGKPESLYPCDSPGISSYRVQISSQQINHNRTSHHTNIST
jgi:hypothetical protein